MQQLANYGNKLTQLSSHETHEQLKQIVQFSKKSFVAMGALLHQLYQDDGFLDAVGEGIDTWEQYLAQPEIGLSTKEASRLMQIYEVFVLRLDYDEDSVAKIPIKSLHYLLPIAKKAVEQKSDISIVDGLVHDATNLSQKDFRERIYDVKTEEQGERTYSYLVMKRCNETNTITKIPGIESEEILEVFKDRINE